MERMDYKIENKIEKPDFKISIFGTGSSKSEHDQRAKEVSEKLAFELTGPDQKVVTGGYDGGVMGTASKGAHDKALLLEDETLKSDGITLGDSFGQPSEHANIHEVSSIIDRLKILIDNSNAVVIFHGKTGTLTEMITAIWQIAGEEMIKKEEFIPKPIIIVDSSLEHTDILSQINKKDSKFKYATSNVYVVSATEANEVDEIVSNVSKIIELYKQRALKKEITENDANFLKTRSLQEFLVGMENFSNGGGI